MKQISLFGKEITPSAAFLRQGEKAGIAWAREVKDGFISGHTHVNEMGRGGVPRAVIMSIAGHAPKDMNERKDTVDDQDRALAREKLETFCANVDQSVEQATHQEKRPCRFKALFPQIWRKCMGIEPTRQGFSPSHRI